MRSSSFWQIVGLRFEVHSLETKYNFQILVNVELEVFNLNALEEKITVKKE